MANKADIPAAKGHIGRRALVTTKSARKKQQPSAKSRTAAPTRRERALTAEVMKPRPRWRWRTFPVFFALVCGLLIASFVNGTPDNTVAAIVQLAAIAGFGYGLAHLFVVNVIVAGREKRRARAIASSTVPAEYFEDETVYPDEAPAG